MINLHIDLDNTWIYQQEYNLKLPFASSYIYTHGLPRLLKILDKYHSQATFMLVATDLKHQAARKFCLQAIKKGHEIANHTYSHPTHITALSIHQKKLQIVKAHHQIKKILSVTPVGFRGPGYYLDDQIIHTLTSFNYQYDSTILPGITPILMKLYAQSKGGDNKHKSFGKISDLFSPLLPYQLKSSNNQTITELPISVLPFLRLPLHTTFAYYFGTQYQSLIKTYIQTKPKYLTYLFHAIDFLDITYQQNFPIIPLRYSLRFRLNFAEKIIAALVLANGKPLKTTASALHPS